MTRNFIALVFKQSIAKPSFLIMHVEFPTCIPNTEATRIKVNRPHMGCAGFLFVPKCKAIMFYKDFLFHLCLIVNSNFDLPNMIFISKTQIPTVVILSVTHLSHPLSLHYLLSQHLHIGCHGETRSLENLFEKMPATSIRHKIRFIIIIIKESSDMTF